MMNFTLHMIAYVSNTNHNIEMSLSAFRNLGSAHTKYHGSCFPTVDGEINFRTKWKKPEPNAIMRI